MASCQNVGSVNRGVRGVVGITALVLALTWFHAMDGGIAGIIAGAVGIMMLLTAAIGMCPLYAPLKLSTCKAAPK